MINIKEAGRYANFLQDKINSLNILLEDEDFILEVKEKHLISKVLKNEEDIEVGADVDKELDISVVDAVFLLKMLINEKMKLSMAINYAKAFLYVEWKEEDIRLPLDTAIEYSKSLRNFAMHNLHNLSSTKSKEYIRPGIGHLINKEGNQTQYVYDIEIIQKINYDRKIIKKQYRSVLEKADILSEEIDKVMLKKIIDYDMEYSVHDSLEDIAENFKNNK